MQYDEVSAQQRHAVSNGLTSADIDQPATSSESQVGRGVLGKRKARSIPGESIHLKRFIRRLQTDNVLTALTFDIDRDTYADWRVWDLACEVYSADQLKMIFERLIESGRYSMGRLAEEMVDSFDRLRDPAPDMDFPSVSAACAAVKREAKARLAKDDYLWAVLDPNTGRSPDRDGFGWTAMTDALLEQMITDRSSKALDMRFARDLGL